MPSRVGLKPSELHNVFDNSLPPILTVDPGAVVTFECPGPPVPRNATVAAFEQLDPNHPHTLVGPVAVRGAESGDVLEIEILSVRLAWDYGHSYIFRGSGLLGTDFSSSYIHIFEFVGDRYAELKPGVRIPLQPFCGVMGVAPEEPGEHLTHPPRNCGGNMDNRHLTAGTILLLPVFVRDGLFSCGDGHAAQGDGEVCQTALETAVTATFRFNVRKGRRITEPEMIVRGPLGRPDDDSGHYVTTAAGPDLYKCSQECIRHMIAYLRAEHGLTSEEAYVLSSLVVDLKISEIVDAPNWLVSAYLPLSVFVRSPR